MFIAFSCQLSARKSLFEEGCYQLKAKLQGLCCPSLPPETPPGSTWAVPTSWEAAILSSPCWLTWFWTVSGLGSSSCRSSFIRKPSYIISETLMEMSPYFWMFLGLSGWGILPLQGLQRHRVVRDLYLLPTLSLICNIMLDNELKLYCLQSCIFLVILLF